MYAHNARAWPRARRDAAAQDAVYCFMLARTLIMFVVVSVTFAWRRRDEETTPVGEQLQVCFGNSASGDCISDPLDSLDTVCDALAATLGGRRLALADIESESSCRSWAAAGECSRNSIFMHERCQLSCLRRLCLTADYDSSAVESAQSLAAAVQRAIAASGEQLPEYDDSPRCVKDPEFDHDDLVTRLMAAWQSGIPADAGCALSEDAVVHEAVGGGSGTPVAARRRLDMLQADVRRDPRALSDANATHLYMDPVCFSRGRTRDVMAAVRGADALRCMASYRKPIPLRRLNQTGVCSS